MLFFAASTSNPSNFNDPSETRLDAKDWLEFEMNFETRSLSTFSVESGPWTPMFAHMGLTMHCEGVFTDCSP